MEKIQKVNVSQQFRKDYQRYGIYVTYKRIMCDIRDGLKPVQRRILYTMLEQRAVDHTVKTATITGATMKYHPHAEVTSSIKPMINWFESYLPLIRGQGSFGTPFGDPEAAPRYTEVCLSDFAQKYIIADLKEAKESVDWVPNYDNTTTEPEYLPVALPMALINGSFGIGLGKKVEMASYNINEVIDATLMLMDNPNAEIVLAPDTCMPCDIFDEGQWKEICETGHGYYTVRGYITKETYNSDEFKNRPALVIKSVPDMTYVDQIKEQIETLVAKKKIIQIEKMVDESGENDLRYVIILKPGADQDYVRNMIYQNTVIQHNVRVNFEMLNGLNVIRPSYKEYLLFFIQHRKQTKYRVYINRLRQIETRMHELEAFIKLLESGKIEDVIEKIRKYKNNNDALVEYIVKLLSVTDLQAKYIIAARLSSLTIDSLKRLKEQYAKMKDMKDQHMKIITDDNALTQVIRDELLAAKDEFGCPRRARLVTKANVKDAIPKGIMLVGITERGYIKKIPQQNNAQFGVSKTDPIKMVTIIDNADDLLLFDSAGKVYRYPVHKIPFSDKSASGVDIRFMFKAFSGVVVQAMSLDSLNNRRSKSKKYARNYIISLSKTGLIKKMEIDEFLSITSAGLLYAKLDQGDFIQSICIANSYQSTMIYGSNRMMRIPVESIPTMKRAAKGNKTIKNGADGMIVIMDNAISIDYVITLTQQGRFNKIPLSSIPAINTPKKEFSVIRLSKTDKIQNIMLATNEDKVVVRCIDMDPLAFPIAGIPVGSTISGGEKVITSKNPIIQSYITNHP